MDNQNFNVGGTGGSLFADNAPTSQQVAAQMAMGEEYSAPRGLPTWKQPSFDNDDRVDPDKLTEKTNGPADSCLRRCFPDQVTRGLIVARAFYFFFFAAFGSLFPLMGVYFKQIGMDTAQCGLLVGIRPIIEYIATPFWNKIADKFQKGKMMLIVSLTCWIVFTEPIGQIHPPVVSCKFFNGSTYLLEYPHSAARDKRETSLKEDEQSPFILDPARYKREVNGDTSNFGIGYVIGTSPQRVDFADNRGVYHKEWITPRFNNEVFERSAVHKEFFLILLLVVIGEFFSSPALALADSAVITLLGEEKQDKYGSLRMFGSIGWGSTMFVMGMVLDHSKMFQDAKCDMNEGQRNYNVCFSVFVVLMIFALFISTHIPFKYSHPNTNQVPMNQLPPQHIPIPGGINQKQDPNGHQKFLEKGKVFAQQLRGLPEFAAVFKAFSNVRLVLFMIVAWIMGVGIGLIFTFLFWHLQDLGGSPTLFGIASVINHLSEIIAYFYSFKIISKIGHVKVLAFGLLCNVLRFLYVSFITWPWLILPFEFIQGVTHAAVWAACCSFIAHNTEPELRASARGVLQGVHNGFGKFCGAVFGGMLIKSHGTVKIFRIYGFVCAAILILFIVVNFYNRNEGGIVTKLPDELDPKHIADGGSHLAPHGVPSGPIPRALSSTKIEVDMNEQHYVPGQDIGYNQGGQVNNPFLDDMAEQNYNYNASGQMMQGGNDDGQYYGRGYTQAQSGYSSSGYGLQ
ncbi:major facilitator superfamily domain-containing protein 6 isoform X2 [Lepeophtheirus salmonis]|nr:major facilitator superfamily domain-containing protein 6-like isoform X2 [Lepeophtheirus salmonis]